MAAIESSAAPTDIVTGSHVGPCCPGWSMTQVAGPETVRGLAVVICTYQRAASLSRFLDSMGTQSKPAQLVIIDASLDDATERMIGARGDLQGLAECFTYIRVTGKLRGLTRQRNFGAARVRTDLIAFFDDDIVLLPGCLSELERVHREFEGVAGVMGFVPNEFETPSLRWRLRVWLGAIPDLRPGRYHRAGISVPWDFQPPVDEVLEGEWIPGGVTMWKTEIVRRLRFNESFVGYAAGEDLEFSLRAASLGRLMFAGRAHLLHLHEGSGRPDPYRLGYMSIRNAYEIHRRCLKGRTRLDVLRFAYAAAIDIAVWTVGMARPSASETRQFLRGRLRFVTDTLRITSPRLD